MSNSLQQSHVCISTSPVFQIHQDLPLLHFSILTQPSSRSYNYFVVPSLGLAFFVLTPSPAFILGQTQLIPIFVRIPGYRELLEETT